MTETARPAQTPGVDASVSASAVLRASLSPAAVGAASFEALYRAHFAYVWRSLARLGIRDADLPDLAHDVFVVVHRKLADYDPARPAKPWLFGICFRVALDKKRKASSFREQLGGDAIEAAAATTPGPDAALAARQAHDLVTQALDVLDFDKRAVFVLCDLEGLSMPEVAALIDAPLNTLYSRLRLARAAFVAEVRRLQASPAQRMAP